MVPLLSFRFCFWIPVTVVLVVKNPPARAGDIRDVGSVPGLRRSPGGGHGHPLQYSCLENPMDRGAWLATVHRVAKSQTQLKPLGIAWNLIIVILIVFYTIIVGFNSLNFMVCFSWCFCCSSYEGSIFSFMSQNWQLNFKLNVGICVFKL